MVRMAPGIAPPMAAIREILRDFDPRLPLFEPQTVDQLLARATAAPRWGLAMMAAFAGIAFVLANVGVAGVVSFLVVRRTRECGIRMALGADPRSLSRSLAAQGVTPVAVGLVMGVAGALAAGRMLQSYLFGISGRDPWILGSAALAFLLCAAVAAWAPARHASRIDPASALRYE
jgi:putative ABC transport system permease protein